jgi:hypothetical protein
MRFWWVNQNQTFRQEFGGGYLWSPQRKRDGTRNAFYESMREVSPGDMIFCFAETLIKATGYVRSYCYECPKPEEFGAVGTNWDQVGWRVDVKFKLEPVPIRPKDHISSLLPHLPERYAPLSASGGGRQSIYLTELQKPLAEALARIMGRAVLDIVQGLTKYGFQQNVDVAEARPAPAIAWEDELMRRIQISSEIPETEKAALVMARLGQGIFKRNVTRIEDSCRITRVARAEHLRASHCKPWRDSSNIERLDGENGLPIRALAPLIARSRWTTRSRAG